MATKRYVALLRGINVGGRNKVLMADLRAAFEEGGFADVGTYIQSGNVLFSSDAARSGLVGTVEELLSRRFDIDIPVAVRSHVQLRNVVQRAPDGFGQEPDAYHSDVLFLRDGLTPARTMAAVELRDGVDQAWAGTGVVYFARLSERRTQSKLSKLTQTPEYQHLTIRSWATTTKLLRLLDGAPA